MLCAGRIFLLPVHYRELPKLVNAIPLIMINACICYRYSYIYGCYSNWYNGGIYTQLFSWCSVPSFLCIILYTSPQPTFGLDKASNVLNGDQES